MPGEHIAANKPYHHDLGLLASEFSFFSLFYALLNSKAVEYGKSNKGNYLNRTFQIFKLTIYIKVFIILFILLLSLYYVNTPFITTRY